MFNIQKQNVVCLSVGNGYFNLYTWFDVDRRDLLHNLGRRVQINDSLVDSHLKDKNLIFWIENQRSHVTWKRSHVFEPSPQGVLRVVMRNVLVGMRTGPLTRSFCFLAPLIRSAHTFSNERTFFDVNVMRIRCTCGTSCFDFSMSLPLTAAAAYATRKK